MAQIDTDLADIERGPRAIGRSTALRRLQPGIQADEARTKLSTVGLDANDDLVRLCTWRSGMDTSIQSDGIEQLCLFPDSYITSLEHSLADYHAFAGTDTWDRNWFPIFPDGGGDFLALTIEGSEAGTIRQFCIDEGEAPLEYESLSALIATVAEAYRRQLFVVDDDWISVDDEQYAAIARRCNPTVEWWSAARGLSD